MRKRVFGHMWPVKLPISLSIVYYLNSRIITSGHESHVYIPYEVLFLKLYHGALFDFSSSKSYVAWF